MGQVCKDVRPVFIRGTIFSASRRYIKISSFVPSLPTYNFSSVTLLACHIRIIYSKKAVFDLCDLHGFIFASLHVTPSTCDWFSLTLDERNHKLWEKNLRQVYLANKALKINFCSLYNIYIVYQPVRLYINLV